MTDWSSDFDTTMRGLERGLRVEEIATFELFQCGLTDTFGVLRDRYLHEGLDYLPVSSDGRIVGVVDLNGGKTDQPVRDHMMSLSEDMLVSSSDAISEVVPLLKKSPFRLVVRRGRIEGIVTRSDLLKLPVRILAFSQVAHLEMLLGSIIETHCPNDEWVSLLNANRKESTLKKQSGLKARRLDPPLLECTEFCDKRDLVKELQRLPKPFEDDLKKIEKLRNQVVHSANYGENIDASREFIARLILTTSWISKMRELLNHADSTRSRPEGEQLARGTNVARTVE